MTDQEIRAQALLCAVTWAKNLSTAEMLQYANKFADYIKGENDEG